jgi:TonB family protein
VFGNEQVHTVYLDMRRTIQDAPVSWTVEFGVKQPEATAASERVATVGGQQEVILPFPIDKERPVMPADLVRKYFGRLVIAYAVVTPEGKMEQLSIKQSPDPALNESVLSALRNWTFRPGRRNGEVISAKILLGIPVRAD